MCTSNLPGKFRDLIHFFLENGDLNLHVRALNNYKK